MIFRLLKISFAILLMALGLWAILLPPFFPSSSYSVVNSRKVSVEAPIEGTIDSLLVKPRIFVTKGAHIATIKLDRSSVEQNLREMEFAETRLNSQIEMTEERLSTLRQYLVGIEQRFREQQAKLLASLRIEQAGVEDAIELLQKETLILKEDERRIKRLMEDGIVTKARWSEVNRATLESEARLVASINERNRIAKDLELARNGLLQEDQTVVSSTSSESTIASTQYELRTTEAELNSLRLKLNETQRLIESAERYLSSSREREVLSPVGGIVWSRHVVNDQTVSTGQSLVQIADESSVYVEGYFHRYYEKSISLGDFAFVRLTGDTKNLIGRVVDIQVQEHGSSDMNIINSVAPSSSMLRVIIEIDGLPLTPDMVGRLGKVVLTRDRPGFINKSLVWLSLRIRNT